VPGDSLHSTPRDRLLPDPGVCAVDTDRNPIVGVVLDQRRVVAGPRLNRSTERVDDGHAELRHQPDTAAGVLH